MDETRTGGGSPGPSTDRDNQPVIDPTKNVLDLVESAILRQDDLRELDGQHLRELRAIEVRHIQEMATLRASYDEKLRDAEAKRIDAIRAVDVGAVVSAANVQATQAATLAKQVADSAEAIRSQLAATAAAFDLKLGAVLDPIQKRIDDLTRAQFQAEGQKTSVIERREASGAVYAAIGLGVSILLALIIIATFIITQSSGA